MPDADVRSQSVAENTAKSADRIAVSGTAVITCSRQEPYSLAGAYESARAHRAAGAPVAIRLFEQ